MIQIVVGIVLILLHIICCILVWVGICTHIINVKKYLMFPVVFIPRREPAASLCLPECK